MSESEQARACRELLAVVEWMEADNDRLAAEQRVDETRLMNQLIGVSRLLVSVSRWVHDTSIDRQVFEEVCALLSRAQDAMRRRRLLRLH